MTADEDALLAARSDDIEALAERARGASVAIVQISESQSSAVGSGVLLRIDDVRLVLTCSHVVEHDAFAGHTNMQLLGPGGSTHVAGRVEGNALRAGERRDQDPVDVAVVRLAPECADPPGSQFLSLADLRTTAAARREILCLGFPVKYARAVHSTRTFDADPLPYISQTIAADRVTRTPLARDVTIAFDMEQKRTRRRSGIEQTLPKFNGMSGGGVWRFNLRDGDLLADRARLVGIFHAYHAHEGLGLATSVRAHLEVITRAWPELRAAVAWHAQTLHGPDLPAL